MSVIKFCGEVIISNESLRKKMTEQGLLINISLSAYLKMSQMKF